MPWIGLTDSWMTARHGLLVPFGDEASKLASVPRLLACPFCRELFIRGEEIRCPSCEIPLVDAAELSEELDEFSEIDEVREPHLELLPPFFMGRGRGALIGLCLLGFGAFFLPWVDMSAPEIQLLSGADLAKRAGWIWSAAVAWFVLLPLVLTRRTIDKMRGARVAAAMLSAIPAVTATVLALFPPKSKLVPLLFRWGAGLYATLALGILGILVAIRFGGRVEVGNKRREAVEDREPTILH